MGDGEGSKAMTIYIVACFLLAMVALVGYKFANQDREELAGEYVSLAGQFADMSAAYAWNINDYYRKVEAGLIKPIDKDVRDNTHIRLREIADDLKIKDSTGNDDHFDIGKPKQKLINKMYWEYTLDVKLKNVTQTEWAVFLSHAQVATREYAHVKEIKIDRDVRRFDRMNIVANRDGDSTFWTVEFTFVWFGPKNEN
ncbi:MAG: hypothetical protein KDB82_14835 [Planctomycetes bacterium]|nr:hypothetical protein [Planctomycetota bacterium]